MGLAVIPDDWSNTYTELCVLWPDSDKWHAVLRGQLEAPNEPEFWDKFTGDPEGPREAIEPTLNQNLHLEECLVIPVGMFAFFGGSAPPSGWLVRDGSEVGRTTYADLFAVIGTLWGPGNGTTTFNLPNAKGRVDVGIDASQGIFDTIGETGGSNEISLSATQNGSHNHLQNAHNHTQDTHNHLQNAHNHTQDTHNHLQNAHNHTQDTHNHLQNAHNHTQNSHNHTQVPHAHIVDGANESVLGSQARNLKNTGLGNNNVYTTSITPTNNAEVAVNQAALPTNIAAIAANQATTPTNITAIAANQATTPTNITAIAANQATTPTNISSGDGTAHNNLQPYGVGLPIIKA
jgi:microcystin-dependent protein